MMQSRPPKRTFDVRTEWHLQAEPEELTAIVLDPDLLAVWCHAVFMDCEILDAGDGRGLGMSVRVYTKGWLPHSFVFFANVSRIVPHRYMRIDVKGDFEGFGEIEIVPRRGELSARMHWNADCHHPFVGPLSRLFPVIFELNHRWAMRRGSTLMQQEIDRRRAGLATPAKPKPTFPHNIPRLRDFFQRDRRPTEASRRSPGAVSGGTI